MITYCAKNKMLNFAVLNRQMKNLSAYIDLGFCIVVLPVMFIMFPIERWYHHFQSYIVSLGIWLYALYFVNRRVVVPFLFSDQGKRMAGILVVAVSFVITYCFSSVSLYTPAPSVHDIGVVRLFPAVKQYQQAVWSLFMIVETFSFAVGLFTQAEIQRARRRAVEAQRDRAEIELYKAKIKPHFMFNTLNSLYGLFLTGSDNALPSLERFISMMRYIHTSASLEMVPLSEETDYIRQFVSLQSLRLNECTEVCLEIDVSDKSLTVPPMLLVTFVENCFKHGVSSVDESTILISIIERDGVLRFQTHNSVFPVKRIGEHLGIENCRKRLNLIYPLSHRLDITDAGNVFEVDLVINLLSEPLNYDTMCRH